MSNNFNLPKESEPEKKEVIRINQKETKYVALESEQIQSSDHAHAYALKQMISPDTKEAQYSLTKETRRAIIIGIGLEHIMEERINSLRACKELVKPIYPRFQLFSDFKKSFDLQSNGDGTTRAQLTQILSVPQMGFAPQGSPFLENIRRNYAPDAAVGPDYMMQTPKKKHFWNRG